MIFLIIVLIALVILGVYIGLYNSFVKLQTQCDEAESQIDVQLKRRNDLIPNLVNTVKGYAKHENSTLTEVTKLRNQIMDAENLGDKLKLSDKMFEQVKVLFNAVAENYPDLKASENFLGLQEELTNTENKIAYSRQLFNSVVNNYNVKVKTFPSNIVAKLHHFTKKDFLSIPETEKETPKVEF